MKSFNFTIVLLLLVLFSYFTFSQEKSGAYDYPIKPGSKEWENLKTYYDVLPVIMIPDDVLKNISTRDLIQTCLNYPLKHNMFVFGSINYGFIHICQTFNGVRELMKREDAANELLIKYKDIDPTDINDNWLFIDKYFYAMEFDMLEVILAQDTILNKLSMNELDNLLEESGKKT
jgi:hypothetical protein